VGEVISVLGHLCPGLGHQPQDGSTLLKFSVETRLKSESFQLLIGFYRLVVQKGEPMLICSSSARKNGMAKGFIKQFFDLQTSMFVNTNLVANTFGFSLRGYVKWCLLYSDTIK